MISVRKSTLGPQKLSLQFVSLGRHYYLTVVSLNSISIFHDPSSLASGFVIVEFTLKIGAIRIDPLTADESVLNPFSNIFHSSSIKNIGSISMFFAI